MGRRFEDVFVPANAAEAAAVQDLLHDHGIDAEILSFHDTAFDGLFQAQKGWGRIRVQVEDAAKARELIASWEAAAPGAQPPGGDAPASPEGDRPSGARAVEGAEADAAAEPATAEGGVCSSREPDGTEAPLDEDGPLPTTRERVESRVSSTWRIFLPGLLGISIALNLFLGLWRNRELPGDLVVMHDKEGRVLAKFYYEEGSESPYETEEFDIHGTICSRMRDRDRDRRFEEFTQYDRTGDRESVQLDRDGDNRYELTLFYHGGKVVARSEDTNADGRHDRLTQLDRGTPRAAIEDRSGDGRYDLLRLLPTAAGSAAQYEDRDGDGFPEHVSCTDAAGKRLRVDARRCLLLSQ